MTFLLFIFGLFVGSFLNALAYRLARGENWFFSRSSCPSCGHKLSLKELIPLLSFLWQRGKCTNCQEKISWRYPLAEIAVGFILSSLWLRFNPASLNFTLYYLFFAVLCLLLFTLALYDFETKEAHSLMLFLLFLEGGIFTIWRQLSEVITYNFADILNFMFSEPVVLLKVPLVFAFFSLFFLVAFVVFRRESFGFGDVLLMTALSFFFTLPELFLVMTFASFLGAGYGIFRLVLARRAKKQEEVESIRQGIPFIPFIASGALLVILFGSDFVYHYIRVFLS